MVSQFVKVVKNLFVKNLGALPFEGASTALAPPRQEEDSITAHQSFDVTADVVRVGFVAFGTHVKGSHDLISKFFKVVLAFKRTLFAPVYVQTGDR
jgi:hypothetical protein